MDTGRNFKIILLAFLFAIAVLSCIHPPFPDQIFLQHITTMLLLIILIFVAAKNNLSNVSFLCVAIFLIFHIIGARYNYSDTPYNRWVQSLLGFDLNHYFDFRRNQYDRLVHFVYGLLIIIPVREIYLRWFKAPKSLSLHIAFLFVLASSMLYELVEWLVAVLMSPAFAEAYNGQQGDLWDAQKDMALAMSGALFMVILLYFFDKWKQKKSK